MGAPNINDYKINVIKLHDEDGGGYIAEIPAIGAIGDGETQEAALKEVLEVGKYSLELMVEYKKIIPKPDIYKADDEYSGKILTRIPKSIHRMLTDQAKIEGCSINQLINTYISMGIGNEIGKKQITINIDVKHETVNKAIKETSQEIWKKNKEKPYLQIAQ